MTGGDYPISDEPSGSGENDQVSESDIKDELYRRYVNGQLVPIEQTVPGNQQIGDYPLSTISPYDDFSDIKRLTPNQQQMRYLLETDDVPDDVSDKLWGLVSRHLQLIDIPDYGKLPRYKRAIRNILRVSLWDRDFKNAKYSDIEQIEFYAGDVLLPKSLNRGERTLLATSIVRQQAEELGERTPTSAQAAATSGGLLAGFRNLLGGYRR